MNVTHIATHLGGGVGRVVLSWLERVAGDSSARHKVYCLENTNPESRARASHASIPLLVEMASSPSGLREAVAGADVVVVHWWNHPLLYNLLVNTPLPDCRLLVWSHVSGHAAPQIFTPSLVDFPDRFILASPCGLEAPAIRALDAVSREGRVRLIFSCAGIERGERVRPTPHDNFTVGYLGTVDYCKMHPSFIRMSAAARIPGVRFVVCGGDRQRELIEQARRMGVADAFCFRGPMEDVTGQLGVFDVFGYPLRKEHYGTGEQALIEAMAAGLPAVVFDNGCERCIVDDGETGFVVRSEEDYTAAIERLYRDEPLRKRLGGRARERARERFRLDTMIAAWNDVLREAMSFGKRPHRWAAKKPLYGARLFIEALGEAGTEFEASLRGGEDALRAETAIAALQGAHRATTRGSAFHYRACFPDDPFLNRWCTLLENGSREDERRPRCATKGKKSAGAISTKRVCPLCGNSAMTLIADLCFAMFDDCRLDPSSPWVACTECGFVFFATTSSAKDFETYYRANAYYASAATSGSGGGATADLRRYDAIIECLARHGIDRNGAVFDVGSGKGGLLQRLHDSGFSKLYAIDLVPQCIEYMRTLGFEAAQGSAQNLPFPGVTPACLICSHLLEHAYDPRSVIGEAYERLGEGGIVYAEVPDASRYGEFQPLPYADLYLEHINHFDELRLSALFAACGFDALESGSRLLDTPGGQKVPCIFGVYRKGKTASQPLVTDGSLERRCTGYLDRCAAAPLLTRLEALASTDTTVYVWGMSQFALLLLGQSALGRCAKRVYIDGDPSKQGRTIGGIPVVSPEKLREARRGDTVVLSGINYRGQMRRFLEEIGFRGREFALDEPRITYNTSSEEYSHESD